MAWSEQAAASTNFTGQASLLPGWTEGETLLDLTWPTALAVEWPTGVDVTWPHTAGTRTWAWTEVASIL